MVKVVKKVIKVQVRGGQANPAPPLGPALGQAGVDISGFCCKFNEATKNRQGQLIPVEVTVYEDRTFSFALKQPPAATLILEQARSTSSGQAKIEKGSGEPSKNMVGTITRGELREIAQIKMPDLNTQDLEKAVKIIEGTARSMGVTIE
jgi:large subunit ribosomal protein L11